MTAFAAPLTLPRVGWPLNRSWSAWWKGSLAGGMLLAAVFALPTHGLAVLLTLLAWRGPWAAPRRRWPLAVCLLVVTYPALVWAALLAPWAAAAWATASLPLLDAALRGQPKASPVPRLGWRFTTVFHRLVMALGAVAVLGVATGEAGLLAAIGAVAPYLLLTALRAITRLLQPGAIAYEAPQIHVLAGSEATATARVRADSEVLAELSFFPYDGWAGVQPQTSTVTNAGIEIALSVRPPLSGPQSVRVLSVSTDARGFVHLGVAVEALQLVVVPRAQVAAHLARRFLEGGSPMLALERLAHRTVGDRRGRGEYWGSRAYVPGDRLQDVDWKHTIKLRQLTVKQFVRDSQTRVGILVNLQAEGAEGVDRLAWDLMTLVLTLASEAIPTTIAAYSGEDVFMAAGERDDPKALVRKTLGLLPRMITLPVSERVLGPPEVAWLSRSTLASRQGVAGGQGVLSGLLLMEREILAGRLHGHPVTRAAAEVRRRLPPPATLVLLSRCTADQDVLGTVADELERSGYSGAWPDRVGPFHDQLLDFLGFLRATRSSYRVAGKVRVNSLKNVTEGGWDHSCRNVTGRVPPPSC